MCMEHALAYLAKGWVIRPEKRGGSVQGIQKHQSRSIVSGDRAQSAARVMAELLCPEAVGIVSANVVSKEDDHGLATTCYRCECCGELTCCSEAEWGNADVVLELGASTGLLAVHVTLEGIE